MKAIAVFCLFLAGSLPVQGQPVESSLRILGGISVQNWHGQVRVQAVDIELSRRRSARTDLAWVIAPMQFEQPVSWFGDDFGPTERVHALSTSLLVRRRYRIDSQRWQPYLEAGGGPVWAERRVPAATSRFNFASQAGFGVTFAPRSRLPLSIGYRFLHISNGGYASRNPGLNVSALTIGVQARR